MNAFYDLIAVTCFYLYVMGVTFYPFSSFALPLFVLVAVLSVYTLPRYLKKPMLAIAFALGWLILSYGLFHSIPAGVVVLIPAAYALLLCFTQKTLPSYESKKQRFVFGLMALVIFDFLTTIVHVGNTYFVFLLLYVTADMCYLRSVRVTSIQNETEFQKQNLLTLLASFLFSIPFTFPKIYYTIRNVVLWGYFRFVYPVFRQILSVIRDLLEQMSNTTGMFTYKRPVDPSQMGSMEFDDVGIKDVEIIWKKYDPRAYLAFRIIAVAVAVLILLWIARRLMKQRKWQPQYHSEGVEYHRERIVEEKIPRGNRGKIRKLYAQYLQYLKKKQVQLEEGFTSEEILKQNDIYLQKSSEADQLRNLYVKARYDLDTEITRADVSRMKKLFAAIKKQNTNE